jgi:hypothetical protein
MTRLDEIEARLNLDFDTRERALMVKTADLRYLLKAARFLWSPKALNALEQMTGDGFDDTPWGRVIAKPEDILHTLRAALDERSDTEASDD